ncbi:family 10 glycosylhydrolase [Mucilaginibacter sp. RS28]|uniref:Family 10 glycosylhydrolase n=1 Tax=Mucilaginibacter straminoryzae TaxID=2932774 RepID=A0A9X2B893_9SPHI|nr:family 10 glycosylhydrolase [Mucilaginibacter straminoryzae]MCJ8209236.1 family 10 glycosylhydrolase [Mucilaginibacter straminoryzae]
MRIKKWSFLAACLLCSFITSIASAQYVPKREFRGVWVATVENIDWPSKPGLPSAAQQQEMLEILNEHQKSNINAVLLQVRPTADAFYGKGREEWSRFLTGKQGKAPDPLYDPLAFAIKEAHKRAMELHAWINPYRASNDLIDSNISATHVTRTHPEWFFSYAGKKYFNPGLPEVRAYIISVVMDIVRNYDIDGIHIDDYFYPYPTKQKLPDSLTYAKYGQGFNTIEDWRRHNVDTLIQLLSDSIHHAKSYVKFGISPFGIWRNLKDDPNGSQSNGFSGYSSLYADARKWVKAGWLDYINPQLYFPFYYPAAPYEKLLEWWSNNAFNRHVYVGQGVYRAMENREGWRDRSQLPKQMRELRKNFRVQGSVFFSSKSVTDNLAGFQDSLRNDFYKYPALLPQMIWLGESTPVAPEVVRLTRTKRSVVVNWSYWKATPKNVYGYVVYRFPKAQKVDTNNPKYVLKISFDKTLRTFTDSTASSAANYKYVVTAIDRLKNESLPSKATLVRNK